MSALILGQTFEIGLNSDTDTLLIKNLSICKVMAENAVFCEPGVYNSM